MFFKSKIYSDESLKVINTLSLCLNNKLCNELIKKINEYLFEYEIGFAFFNNKKYLINNKLIYYNLINKNIEYLFNKNYYINMDTNPLEIIIRIYSEYLYCTSNEKYNKCMNIIKNTPNCTKIDLIEILSFLKKKNNNINYLLNNASLLPILLSEINKYIGITYNTSITFIYNTTYTTSYINKYYVIKSNYNNNETLENIIIKNNNNNNILNYYYQKILLLNNNIILFEINRNTINNNKIIIPKILNLPNYIFYKCKKNIYNLIAVILCKYINNIKYYSLIIKLNNTNNYYHFFNDSIILVNDDYLDFQLSNYSTYIFYKIKKKYIL
jgi:hypothetical protein